MPGMGFLVGIPRQCWLSMLRSLRLVVAVLNINLITIGFISHYSLFLISIRPSARLNLNLATTPQSDSLKLLAQIGFGITREIPLWPFRACLSQLSILVIKNLKWRLDISQSGIHHVKTYISGLQKFCQAIENFLSFSDEGWYLNPGGYGGLC